MNEEEVDRAKNKLLFALYSAGKITQETWFERLAELAKHVEKQKEKLKQQEKLDRLEEAKLIKKYANDKDEAEAYEWLFDMLRQKPRQVRERFVRDLFNDCEKEEAEADKNI